MKKFILIFCFFYFPWTALSQSDKSHSNLSHQEKPFFGIKFSGFVKSDFFYDSRQTVNLREGHFFLYPAPKIIDTKNSDINDEPSFNFLSIQTRLTGNITAPDFLGAKVTGVIESDFFGNENANFVDANGFRLRHAYAKLNWENTELLFGQFWHPLFIPSSFSEVISFNTGAPFQPFSRNPQMKITQKIGSFSIIAALCEQRDFTSQGGSVSLRNSAIPEVQGQLQYEEQFNDGKYCLLAGAGGGYKVIRPYLYSEKYEPGNNTYKKFITEETVKSMSSTFFLKFKADDFICKLQGVYGENLYDLTMLGGYGISEITSTIRNSVAYTPIKTFSGWTEIMQKVGKFQLALWAGYTDNLGSDKKILAYTSKNGGSDATMRGTATDNSYALKNILRISPRIVYHAEKINFAFELEYTSAGYAAKNNAGILYRDDYGKIKQTEQIANIRPLLAVILKF